MSTSEERSCSTCAYYSRHYCWSENGFCAVNCGHCTNINRPIEERINYSFVTCCKFWECGKKAGEERKNGILKAVKNMAQRIDETEAIFEDKT